MREALMMMVRSARGCLLYQQKLPAEVMRMSYWRLAAEIRHSVPLAMTSLPTHWI
jgi:hypothetical protein